MRPLTVQLLLSASLVGVLALGACSGSSGPSETQMSGAIAKNAESLGGHINDPDLQNAITQCKSGAAQITDSTGQTLACHELCGEEASKCDLSVKVTSLKKAKCTAVKDKKGVFECSFTMVIASPSKWLNAMLHQANPGVTDESKIPRTAQFKQDKGEWAVADYGG